MRRVRAILAEDEPVLLAELSDLLEKLWPELHIAGKAQDGIEAVQLLESVAPDVLFLDIQMPGMTGLDVAKQASGKCHVVFVTAYDSYAVAAFDEGAVDYVMKPLSAPRLATAIARVKSKLASAPPNLDGILRTLGDVSSRKEYLRWIPLRKGASFVLLPSTRSAMSRRTTSTRSSSRRTANR